MLQNALARTSFQIGSSGTSYSVIIDKCDYLKIYVWQNKLSEEWEYS